MGEAWKLPPISSLKWVRQGLRKPLAGYPTIPCSSLFAEGDLELADGRMVVSDPKLGDWGSRDVYFIKGAGVPTVKIGRTVSHKLDHRLAELQTGSPVVLSVVLVVSCGHVENALSIEFRLHEMFKESRIHGEWFRLEGRLLEFIRSMGAKYE